MRHQDLTINHILESFVYANAAARNAATGFVAGDVGRIAYQIDTGQYFRLLSTTPTWQLIGPQTPQAAAYAVKQTASMSPAGTSLASPGVMMGLGVGNTFTPTATGKVLATISGTLANNAAAKYSDCQMRYGTGTPPANGAVGTTGTAIGTAAIMFANNANDGSPFSLSFALTGLAVGVAYWFDLAAWTSAGGVAIVFASVTLTELP